MELNSHSWTEVGTFNYTLVISLPNYPLAHATEVKFKVEVVPPYLNQEPVILGEIYKPKDYITLNGSRNETY